MTGESDMARAGLRRKIMVCRFAKRGLMNRQCNGASPPAIIGTPRFVASSSAREMFMRVSVKSAALLAGVIAACVGGQALADGPVLYDGYKVPHDSLGRPDLTAVWSSATITRLERKPSFGQRLVMTPREVEAAEGRIKAANDLAAQPTDPKATVKDLPADCSDGRAKACNYNSVWPHPGSKVARFHGEPPPSIFTPPNRPLPLNPTSH